MAGYLNTERASMDIGGWLVRMKGGLPEYLVVGMDGLGRLGCKRVVFLDPLAILSVWSIRYHHHSWGFMAWISWRILFETLRLFMGEGGLECAEMEI